MAIPEALTTYLELRQSNDAGDEGAGLSHTSSGLFLLHVLELASYGEPRGAVGSGPGRHDVAPPDLGQRGAVPRDDVGAGAPRRELQREHLVLRAAVDHPRRRHHGQPVGEVEVDVAGVGGDQPAAAAGVASEQREDQRRARGHARRGRRRPPSAG